MGCTSGFGASLSFSSPGATVLFFLKEEKEKNGGAKKRAGNARPYRERQKRKHPPLG